MMRILQHSLAGALYKPLLCLDRLFSSLNVAGLKIISHLLVFFASLQLVSAAVETQAPLQSTSAGPLDLDFESLANKTLQSWNVPGLSLAVIDGDNLWSEGYGIAVFPDTPVTPSTLFYGGSTTKAFTAAAISLLVDDNEKYPHVKWNTPIANLIREDFVLENDYVTTHTTIEDALSHRTGMPRHDMSYGGTYDGQRGMPRDVVRSLRHLPLTAEPRALYQYCNMMFVVAAHVVETLEGVWLGDFLRERIWEPLGMKSTYFSTEDAKKAPESLAQGYTYYNNEYLAVPYMDLSVVSGAGSIVSNVLDYSKWIKSLIDSSGPVSKAGHAALKTSRTLVPDSEESSPYTGVTSYALGWVVGVYKGHEFIQHSGGMEAFGTNVVIFPALKYGLVAFGNTAVTANVVEEILMWHLIDEKLGIPKEERYDWDGERTKQLEKQQQEYNNATNILFPTIPSPPLPPTLPLSNYTGTYHHPAYRNVTIESKDGALFTNRSNVAWKIAVDYHHVSRDYFIGYVDSTTAPGLVFKSAVPAEFVVGSDGVVKKFGVGAEPSMGKELIWFDRV